ncbi:amino acid ABC transporter permease [Cognatishimia maritima]|uniref:Polar amino acid transport system permease protein n=1 Tax=Cognatishimia maritima TaxID=870908 RepID=A0A1M5QB72_9RHOB|nr:amino acid ABC transporter permease [Cognatishimia maritima]SHH11282.1 polar amino acid transport system permease protein [Cognatishimia maritima]
MALPQVLVAVLTNAWLAVVICFFALITGALLTVVRTFKAKLVNKIVSLFISFIQGTPILVQIFLAYYALPAVGLNLSAISAGILALTVNSSVFITEIFRGGLRNLEDGQIEAAATLGLKPFHIWRLVIFPQLLRVCIPMLVSESSMVLKATALLSVITVVEGLRVAQQIGASEFSPFEPYLAVGAAFAAIYLVIVVIGKLLESRLALIGGRHES